MTPSHDAHIWNFFRAGGFDQVSLERAEDLKALPTLDQKLWVALSCPVKGNYLEERTLQLIDTNDDGRIRAPEILAAVAWCFEVFRSPEDLLKRHDGMPLAALNLESPRAQTIHKAAERLMKERGDERGELNVSDTTDACALMSKLPFNGDGVITQKSALTEEEGGEALAELIAKMIELDDQAPTDRGGERGVGAEQIDNFFKELSEYDAWWREAESADEVMVPLGDDTASAVEAFMAVQAKIEDYFTRVELAAFDARATAHLMYEETQWEQVAHRTLSRKDGAIADFPLSHVAADRPLPLAEGLNPAWMARMSAFVSRVVTPILGAQQTLTRAQWEELKGRFATYEGWLEHKKGGRVEGLGIEKIREILQGDTRQRLEGLVARDAAMKSEAEAVVEVERAVRYYRDLHRLLENFVNFRDFYDKSRWAIFQAGTLYLDARSCELCLDVEDAAKHAAMATQSFAFLAYCDCQRKSTGQKKSIVAAFTDGDADFLSVGRNGLFYDRDGNDWDATITKVVEQPISIRQAFWNPYKRLAKFLSSQAEKFAAAEDKSVSEALDKKASEGQTRLQAAAAPPAKQAEVPDPKAATTPPGAKPGAPSSGFDIARYAGIFAALGLAAGFIVSGVTLLVTSFLGLKVWQMPLALLGALLLISGPSMLLAAFKLRQRNLAPLLDANGWAINTRARLNIPFGASLTEVAHLPHGARRTLRDPYQEKATPWWLYILIVLVICAAAILWDLGLAQRWLGLNLPEDQPDVVIQAPEAAVETTPPAPATDAPK